MQILVLVLCECDLYTGGLVYCWFLWLVKTLKWVWCLLFSTSTLIPSLLIRQASPSLHMKVQITENTPKKFNLISSRPILQKQNSPKTANIFEWLTTKWQTTYCIQHIQQNLKARLYSEWIDEKWKQNKTETCNHNVHTPKYNKQTCWILSLLDSLSPSVYSEIATCPHAVQLVWCTVC